ncbi:hypothetical protein SJDPG2_04960 [Porphyromonas gingivalis SJD2]|nr:hypothetical protein SJDPG2_04960 [Porphyromonas gingivalis SJD2]OWR76658.1 hypothetical protein SJDPG5_07460 [Porphyromonas gingivalis SJD5]
MPIGAEDKIAAWRLVVLNADCFHAVFYHWSSGVEDENGSEVRLPLCPPFPAKGTKRIKGVMCGRNEFSNSKMLDCCSCFAENMRVNFFDLAREIKIRGGL